LEFVGVGFPDPFGFGRENPAPTIRASNEAMKHRVSYIIYHVSYIINDPKPLRSD